MDSQIKDETIYSNASVDSDTGDQSSTDDKKKLKWDRIMMAEINEILDMGQKIYLMETNPYKVAREKTNPKFFENCDTIEYQLFKKMHWYSGMFGNLTRSKRPIIKFVDLASSSDNLKYARFLFLNKPFCILDKDYVSV